MYIWRRLWFYRLQYHKYQFYHKHISHVRPNHYFVLCVFPIEVQYQTLFSWSTCKWCLKELYTFHLFLECQWIHSIYEYVDVEQICKWKIVKLLNDLICSMLPNQKYKLNILSSLKSYFIQIIISFWRDDFISNLNCFIIWKI